MKTVLVTTIGAVLAGTAISQPPPNPVRDALNITPTPAQNETVREKARNFWIKSKGYLSEDQITFTEGAKQTLSDLGKEIDEVAAKVGAAPPMYFQTRLQSLRQQHSYLHEQLNGLTPDTIKTRMSGPRYAFDKGVGSLEDAVGQAENDADRLAKVSRPEKQ
jgi:hypothetical protein